MEVDNVKVKDNQQSQSKFKEYLTKFLFILFGIGTWLNLNGVWIELPLLIPRLSEGWGLSPQLGMASNIANVGPLIITLIRTIIGKSSAYEVPSICVIFSVGIICPIILSFTWPKQVLFFGKNRSLYLITLSFFLALVNCTSSVTYLPFVNRFDPSLLNVYFGGEALSSLIPAMIGLIQGVGHEPECIIDPQNPLKKITKLHDPSFSVNVYFNLMSFIMVLSFISFLIIWFNQKKFKKNIQKKTVEQEIVESSLMNNQESVLNEQTNVEIPNEQKKEENNFSRESYIYLFIVLWSSILLIGCIPSINSFSLNPYGSKTFHYVIILTQCCYPLVSLIANLFPNLFKLSLNIIIFLTVTGTAIFFYIFFTAIQSPCSPFVDQLFGSLLIGLMWMLIYIIFYSVRVSLGNYFNEKVGHRGLYWYGFLTQAGAFTGALFIFTLNSLGRFHEKDFCDDRQCYSG